MSATDELRRMLDELGVEWQAPASFDGTARYDTTAGGYWFHEFNGEITIHGLTPAQAIAATLGSDRLAFLEEKVRLQGDYIAKLTKENNALFAQSCEAATRHAGQIDAMQRKLEAATLGAGTCHLKPWEMERDTGFYDSMECDCGYVADVADWAEWRFCPNCGRKVVDE